MNIADFISRSRKRLWIVILTAAFAASAALGVSAGQPQQYVATATVTVPTPSGAAPTGQVINQSVENLRAAIQSQGLAQAVNATTGYPIGEVKNSLRSQRLRAGNVVEITAESDNADQALGTAQVSALEVVKMQVAADLALAQETVILARLRFDEADAAVTEFAVELGPFDPEEELNSRTVILLDAQRALAAANTAVNRAAVANAEASIAELVPRVLDYRTILQEQDAAFEELSEALSVQLAAQAAAEVAPNVLVVLPQQAAAVSSREETVQAMILAGVLGLVLGFGIVAVLEVFPRRAAKKAATQQAGSQESPDVA